MIDLIQNKLPEYREWSDVAVRLMKGAIYREEGTTWDMLLRNVSALEEYFGRIAVQVVVDESEGLAFLSQIPADQLPPEYEDLPQVFRRTRLNYESTLLAVLLRDRFRAFEEESLESERCVVDSDTLFDDWRVFFPSGQDDVRLRRSFLSAVRTLEGLKFLRRFDDGKRSFEIRRLIKARLLARELEAVHDQLQQAVTTTEDSQKALSESALDDAARNN